ncbi:hypothetical protein [Zavarzinella formosa]|uniref:hypothetical protein n=1 Tax=Zavarzinella formosa TaxID=360055 RepID=UPI0002E78A31|nr:hypothetical protein [Zavarzinella formosa]
MATKAITTAKAVDNPEWRTPAEAGELLHCHKNTINRTYAGVFTEIRPYGFGRGKPVFYLLDEINLFKSTGDRDAVREHRKKLKRLSK